MSRSQVIPPPPSHTNSPASSPSRIPPVCFQGPRHHAAPLPLAVPTSLCWHRLQLRPAQADLSVCSGQLWQVLAKECGGDSGASHHPSVPRGHPVLQPISLGSSKVPPPLKHVGSFEIIVVLKLPLLNQLLFSPSWRAKYVCVYNGPKAASITLQMP